MTSGRFRELLDAWKLTNAEFARLLGITDRHVRRYISGEHGIPTPTAMLLEFAFARRISLEEISQLYNREKKRAR
jgi:plasmid maintenance system antidote protein VapI